MCAIDSVCVIVPCHFKGIESSTKVTVADIMY